MVRGPFLAYNVGRSQTQERSAEEIAALWTLRTADCSPKACTLAAFLCTIAFCTIYESKIHLNEVNQPGADIIIILIIIMT
jgi:hypothetical protein